MSNDTPATAFVRGTGGAIFEMDVPTYGHALERWDQALTKGDLVIVTDAHWVDRADGSAFLVEGKAPAALKGKATKTADEAEQE